MNRKKYVIIFTDCWSEEYYNVVAELYPKTNINTYSNRFSKIDNNKNANEFNKINNNSNVLNINIDDNTLLEFVIFGIDFEKEDIKLYNDRLKNINGHFLDFDNVLNLKDIFMVIGELKTEGSFPCEIYESEKKI